VAARIEKAQAGVLLLAEADGTSFGVAAAWPDTQRDLTYLGGVAQEALTEVSGVVTAPDGGTPESCGPAYVGYPVEVTGRVVGAVVFDVGVGAADSLQAALRQIHWASAWLLDYFGRQQLAESQAEVGRLALLEESCATALQYRALKPSALSVANELVSRLQCDRVSIGLDEGGQIKVVSMSHAATFDERSNLVRAIASAMDEVLDLGVPVVVPAPSDDELGAIAHAESARVLHAKSMLSVPLLRDSQTIGAITFERSTGEPFSVEEQRIAGALGVMLAPLWALLREQERSWWQRTREATRSALQQLFGPHHPGAKLAVGLAALLIAALALIQKDYRVVARTVIEGSTQITSAAPFEGFIAKGFVRAGDTVRAGQSMAQLDERDLTLERAKWSAELDQLQRKHQVAMAEADRSAMVVLGAQIDQTKAQLALAEERLARATVLAPFDGVVVSGDLSQSIGMPVKQGDELFVVAPLEGYRVVLQVRDRDIARVALEQGGELVLSSLPDRALPFTVSAIAPVTTQVDGYNVFRVEALVTGTTDRLRPGMEGIGKVTVGRRSLLWIFTHNFTDWLRLTLWNWMP